MKKAAAAILILDCILGLLLFGLSENRRAAVTTAGGDASAAVWGEEVERKEAEEDVKKIALTFDDDVIIGLSQEIRYKEAVSMI